MKSTPLTDDSPASESWASGLAKLPVDANLEAESIRAIGRCGRTVEGFMRSCVVDTAQVGRE